MTDEPTPVDPEDFEDLEDEDEDDPHGGLHLEVTRDAASQSEVPARPHGGPPQRDELSMTTDEMARRALEDATEAEGREMVQDDRREDEPIEPDTLPG